jgi:hypothetical protein
LPPQQAHHQAPATRQQQTLRRHLSVSAIVEKAVIPVSFDWQIGHRN